MAARLSVFYRPRRCDDQGSSESELQSRSRSRAGESLVTLYLVESFFCHSPRKIPSDSPELQDPEDGSGPARDVCRFDVCAMQLVDGWVKILYLLLKPSLQEEA